MRKTDKKLSKISKKWQNCRKPEKTVQNIEKPSKISKIGKNVETPVKTVKNFENL